MKKIRLKKTTNPNPSPANQFKKGNKAAALARRGILPRRELKEWTRATVAEAYKKYISMSVSELREVKESFELPAIEVVIAGAILNDRMEGRMENIERILDRAIGRVPIESRSQLTGADGVPLVPPQIIFEAVGKVTEEGMGST